MKKAVAITSLLALALPVVLASSANASDSKVLGVNSDGSKVRIDYPIDAQTQAIIKEKEKLVQMHKEVRAGKRSKQEVDKGVEEFGKRHGGMKRSPTASSKADDPSTLQTMVSAVEPEAARYSSNYITNLIQEAQINGYYCGPATASAIIKSKGIQASQSQTAAYMGTNTYGETPWYNGTYPMRDALNYYISGSWYSPYGTSVTTTEFKDKVTFDIDYGYGVAGDAYQVPNGPHLNGHPDNQTILHWFAIDGYSAYGDSTHYADPASGCSALTWGNQVPRYSTLTTTKVATIVDGRGIIW
ncbi:C39 family peptidase [Tumebacillus lipolyticus]|uniref:C39 family peptidase n=1 Tax=Tumebacillus lipolyticus TaxID=1280370 RepID=A0ABW4ZXI1_9BACL